MLGIMGDAATTSGKAELSVEVDHKYHFFRNESEISNESKVYVATKRDLIESQASSLG